MAAGVYVLRLEGGPLHVLGRGVRQALLRDLNAAVADHRVHTVLIVGGRESFSVGADLRELAESGLARTKSEKEAAMRAYVDAYREHNLASLVYAIDQCPKPTAVLISGQCLGGGLEVAMAANYRFCSESSIFRLPEVLAGIIPGALGTQILPRLVPFSVALKMCSGKCESLSASEALQAGLVDQIIDSTGASFESVVSRAVQVLRSHISRGPDSASPFRQSSALPCKILFTDAIKSAMQFSNSLPRADRGGLAARGAVEALLAAVSSTSFLHGAQIESEISRRLVVSDEAQALRYLFFAEKSLKASAHQQQQQQPRVEIETVGIVGAGIMGVGIGAAALLGGMKVVLCDVSEEALAKSRTAMDTILTAAKNKKRWSTVSTTENYFQTTTAMTQLANCDLVVECVFEDLSVKKQVFEQLDAVCHPRTLLVSNTSSLDVDEMAAATKRPSKVLGLHFFTPAHIMPLVEIIKCNGAAALSKEDEGAIERFVAKMGKVGVWCKNCPGFVGNRMVFVYVNEALLLLEDGASVVSVDNAMRAFGLPMGPFQMMDLSGLDVGFRIRQQLLSTQNVRALRESAIADELYKAGRLGQKNGKGFYNYSTATEKGNKPQPPDSIVEEIIQQERHKKGLLRNQDYPNEASAATAAAAAAAAAAAVSGGGEAKSGLLSSGLYSADHCEEDQSAHANGTSAGDIQRRLLLSLANEGFKALGEGGVLSYRPGDIDVIYVRGYGWPPHLGGPLFWADHQVGLENMLRQLKELLRQYPDSAWFEPAPLLLQLVKSKLSIFDLQRDPALVRNLLSSSVPSRL